MKKSIYFSALTMALSVIFTGAYAEELTTPENTPIFAVPTAVIKMPEVAAVQVEARKPIGDVDTFWNALRWDQLSATEQGLFQVLGWNSGNWQGNKVEEPASENKDWDKLSKEEQLAASTLGYDQTSWNTK